jgi:hypothetical protein
MVHTARYMVKELLVRLNRMPEVMTIKWLSVALLYSATKIMFKETV